MPRLTPTLSAFVTILLLLLPTLTHAAEPDTLHATAQNLADQITASPTLDSASFSPDFRKAVTTAQLTDLLRSLHKKNGPVRSIALQSRTSPLAGKFTFRFADSDMPVTLTLQPAPPHPIASLWFGPTVPRLASLDEALQKLAKFPGKTSLQLLRISDEKILASHNPDAPLAIGSAFKLYLLAALIHDATPLDRVIELDDSLKSLPSGDMQNWPVNSPVTLHTLALKMISQSDNTATDNLLAHLTPARIEKLLPALGQKSPALNTPFLSTRQVFQLKANAPLREKFLAASPEEKQKLLTDLRTQPLPKISDLDLAKPVAISDIEWFASSADLRRLLAWLDKKSTPESLALLTVNPGIDLPASRFPLIAFKGGSETGVLNLTFLLHAKDGQHYALTATWNNPEKPLDDEKLIALLQAITDLIPVANPASTTQKQGVSAPTH